eukprot:Em0019g1165a
MRRDVTHPLTEEFIVNPFHATVMKERFTTVDLFAVLHDLRSRLVGMRAANVYDVDQKTYLIKFARPDEKAVLLFESGCRMHTTEFDWPKNMQPSGFAMKCRKHLRTRRLTALTQLGVDRVVDFQFGSGEGTYHLIIELYDRGNVILTDSAYTILSLLRTRTDADTDVRFAVRETYALDSVKNEQPVPTPDQLKAILAEAKPGDQLKHVLNPHFVYGTPLLTHCLLGAGISESAKLGAGFSVEKDMDSLVAAFKEADLLFSQMKTTSSKGYVIQKRETAPQLGEVVASSEEMKDVVTNVEFHPMLFRQHEKATFVEYDTFNQAVDYFFSVKTSQKQDVKALQIQKGAFKKLEFIKSDHQKRISALKKAQEEDAAKACLIELNVELVEGACLVIRSAVASAMDWGDIELLLKDAQARGDPVAMAIQALKLQTNEITLLLMGIEGEEEEEKGEEPEEERERQGKKKKKAKKGTKVDIDLSLSAHANARRYYDQKRHAATKEQKTIDASEKAFKSAERKTKMTLKEASAVAKIQKARKVHWFEKFYWFISSENYLVIGGRDQQQNELIVKKYFAEGDVYVHADLHGASSVVIKNHAGGPVPPKTLTEAGCMAVCYSTAWDSRIITNAWWVHYGQVSKTAPTGEYLTTGSFMIRGKKNMLPPCQLMLGFGFIFRVDESCIANHLNERRVRGLDEDEASLQAVGESKATSASSAGDGEEEIGNEDTENEEGADAESEGSGDDGLFPNTSIQLQHVGGENFELQRGTSVTSSVSERQEASEECSESAQNEGAEKKYQHLSVKQRKELHKQKNGGHHSETKVVHQQQKPPAQAKQEKVAQALPPKRGQKSKAKKVQQKYKDQDEEERMLRMKILASAGIPSGGKSKDKKGSKDKGGRSNSAHSSNPKHKYLQKKDEVTLVPRPSHKQMAPMLVAVEDDDDERADIVRAGEESSNDGDSPSAAQKDVDSQGGEEGGQDKKTGEEEEPVKGSREEDIRDGGTQQTLEGDTAGSSHPEEPAREGVSDEDDQGEGPPEQESDDEEKQALMKEENIHQLEEALKEQVSILDSLTGCPLPDDILLYIIPVCAPYTALTNYKFKVKLVPGTNRRGKAAKAAVLKFIQTKDTHQREKDLLKSVRDTDMSRYFPGKVKMTLSN